jgi:tight adherence protein C
MRSELFFLVFLAWFCLLVSMIFFCDYVRKKAEIKEKVKKMTNLSGAVHPRPMKHLHHWFWVLGKWGERIPLLNRSEDWEREYIQAGSPVNWTFRHFQGARLFYAGMGLLAGVGYTILGLPFPYVVVFLFFLGGFMFPMYQWKQRVRKRQGAIRQELPDFLDLIVISLESGIHFDQALGFYLQISEGTLKEEWGQVEQEFHLGMDRESALRSVLKRAPIQEMERLIHTLIQADRFGTPLAPMIREQAQEMRRIRLEQAKEIAGKATVKISLISGLLLVPSIMLLLLGMILLKNVHLLS